MESINNTQFETTTKIRVLNSFNSLSPAWHQHTVFMQKALEEAKLAYEKDEVPVGAVIVHENRIIGRGHNQVEMLSDPTAHAEMIAISAACNTIQDKFLQHCTLYVTLEPCPMCAGALVWSRINRMVIGSLDAKAGACGSVFNLASSDKLNHSIEIIHSVLEDECADLLRRFFRQKR